MSEGIVAHKVIKRKSPQPKEQYVVHYTHNDEQLSLHFKLITMIV